MRTLPIRTDQCVTVHVPTESTELKPPILQLTVSDELGEL